MTSDKKAPVSYKRSSVRSEDACVSGRYFESADVGGIRYDALCRLAVMVGLDQIKLTTETGQHRVRCRRSAVACAREDRQDRPREASCQTEVGQAGKDAAYVLPEETLSAFDLGGGRLHAVWRLLGELLPARPRQTLLPTLTLPSFIFLERLIEHQLEKVLVSQGGWREGGEKVVHGRVADFGEAATRTETTDVRLRPQIGKDRECE